MSDLAFVDPADVDATFRVCLWAAPGQGKSVAAASAPAPILLVSADRPMAYAFARKHHGHTSESLREVRFTGKQTLEDVYRYLHTEDGAEIRTVVLDPFSNVYDVLLDQSPVNSDGDPDYQGVNKTLLGFVKALRGCDVNVVLVAHERLNDGKRGDGKLYPALGGPALINKVLAELDICARIERREPREDGGEPLWVGQLQPVNNLVTKDATGSDALGPVRIADLTRWFELASAALAPDATANEPVEVA